MNKRATLSALADVGFIYESSWSGNKRRRETSWIVANRHEASWSVVKRREALSSLVKHRQTNTGISRRIMMKNRVVISHTRAPARKNSNLFLIFFFQKNLISSLKLHLTKLDFCKICQQLTSFHFSTRLWLCNPANELTWAEISILIPIQMTIYYQDYPFGCILNWTHSNEIIS